MCAQTTDEDIQTFDRRSSEYEHSFLQVLFFDRVHRATLRLIPENIHPKRILDIGCGTGRLLRKTALRWPDAQLFGVDPAEGMIAAARQWTPTGIFHVSRAEALPLPDTSIDLALSTTSFHHWFDQAEGLRQVARVLVPGGWFCLADVVPPFGLSKVFKHGRQVEESGRQALFKQAGLEVKIQRRYMGGFILITFGTRV